MLVVRIKPTMRGISEILIPTTDNLNELTRSFLIKMNMASIFDAERLRRERKEKEKKKRKPVTRGQRRRNTKAPVVTPLP